MKFKVGDRVWFHAGGHHHDTGVITEVVEPHSYLIKWDKDEYNTLEESILEEDLELTTRAYNPDSNPFRGQ